MGTEDSQRLEGTMRRVVVRLALTTNGTTAKWDSSGGGEPDYTPRLGHADAPHLHYVQRWNATTSDLERARLCEKAADELDQILKSRGSTTKVETKKARNGRIVREGRGWPARDVAIRFRCAVRDVHEARRNAGLDLDKGEQPAPVPLGDRRARLEQLVADGRSVRQAAVTLGISYVTARRDLGLRAN